MTNFTYQLNTSFLTTRGRRSDNQDAMLEYIPRDAHTLVNKGALFALADGLGGHNAGEVASHLALQTLAQAYYQDRQNDLPNSLERAAQQANYAVWSLAQRRMEYRGMGTTLVAIVARGNQIFIANVGDSRAYLARAGRVWQLTRDHSFAAELVAQGVRRVAPKRDAWGKTLTRALGQAATVQVDLFQGILAIGDTYFLCTDGVSDFVTSAEIARVLQRRAQPASQARTLLDRAYHAGSRDNLTSAVIYCAPAPLPVNARILNAHTLPLRVSNNNMAMRVDDARASTNATLFLALSLGMVTAAAWFALLLRLVAR